MPAWFLGLAPLALIGALLAIFSLLDAPGLGERRGPPGEELAVERTVLQPGSIKITLRNGGRDPVGIAQVSVNDGFVDFDIGQPELGRLAARVVHLVYPWVEGEAYEIGFLTRSGGVVTHEIPVAVATPDPSGFLGLMALLGVYVGVIPVALGMLWLPWLRRVPPTLVQVLMSVTVGLLVWLALDAGLEGIEVSQAGATAFGGQALVLAGASVAYLLLSGVAGWLARRNQMAWLIAIGIGVHNFGEGLAIGSAYAVGALALGASLVVGFAIHNTTEGLAIVAPLSDSKPKPSNLAALGLTAGAPAILGAWLGAAAFHPAVAAFLLGFGVGAIAQVVTQVAPAMRDAGGQLLHPRAVAGVLAGLAIMYGTGLLV